MVLILDGNSVHGAQGKQGFLNPLIHGLLSDPYFKGLWEGVTLNLFLLFLYISIPVAATVDIKVSRP